MMRSYLGLSLALSCCLAFGLGCGSSDGGGGSGGTGGGMGGTGGTPPSGGVQEKDITLGCSNTVTPNISILPATLKVDSGEISGGAEFATTLSGSVSFPVVFLDTALMVIPGLKTAELIAGQTIVQVRSGATETGGTGGTGGVPGVVLVADVASLTPGSTYLCGFSLGTCSTTTTQLCDEGLPGSALPCPEGETCEGLRGANVKPCDPANDNGDGSNPACLLTAVPDEPVCQEHIVVDLPISEDCAADGVCDKLGKGVCAPGLCDGGADDGNPCDTTADCAAPGACDNCLNGTQCGDNQFCITGNLEIPLTPTEQAYTADASGEILFGWADEGLTDPTIDACVGGTNKGKACTSAEDCPDGTCVTGLYVLPKPSSAPLEQGIVVNAGGIGVTVGCVMAVDSAGPEGVAVCSGGDNDGASCEQPADVVDDDICFGGTNDGEACDKPADCPEGECANPFCGAGSKCEPADLASYTPDGSLIRYSIP